MTISLNRVTELILHVPRSKHCEKDLTVSLGDTVYYPMWWDCLVVEARVEELQFILGHPRYEKKSIWLYLDPILHGPKGYLCLAPKVPEEKDKLGWTVQEEIDPEEILTDPKTVLYSWGAWLDLPIGHAVWPELDLFLDPSVPLRFIRPRKFRKRRRKSVLNRFITRGKRSLAINHKKSIDQMNFPAYRTFKDRKVYWRRK